MCERNLRPPPLTPGPAQYAEWLHQHSNEVLFLDANGQLCVTQDSVRWHRLFAAFHRAFNLRAPLDIAQFACWVMQVYADAWARLLKAGY
jgi:hypothetical protein